MCKLNIRAEIWTKGQTQILDWLKCLYGFFHKIKDTFFIFTNNFIDLDILSTGAISHVKLHCSQLMSQLDCYQLQLVYLTIEHHPERNLQQKLPKPLVTSSVTWNNCEISHVQTALSPYTAQISFCISVVFTFLEIINIICQKCCRFSSIFNIKILAQKFTNFYVF